MTKEEMFEQNVFFISGKDNNNFIKCFSDGKNIIVRLIIDNKIKSERKYGSPPWQTPRLLKDMLQLLTDNGFNLTGVEGEMADMYDQYLDWKRENQNESNDSNDNIKPILTSGLKNPLVEEIIKDGHASYVWFNDSLHGADQIVREGQIYLPIMDDAILQQAVLLPSGVEEYGTVELLIKELQEHIIKYLDVDPSYVTFASYYVLLSWVYDRLDTLPYLRALGDTGTGKSRFLRVLGGLCYKPIIVSGAITPAPIYRMIRRWQGTIVLDEADFKDSNEKNEVVTILNCGFSKGTPVIRCEKDNPDNVQILPTFSPKVIATRQSFGDKALESRCLTEIMKQTKRKDLPRILPGEFYVVEEKLRNKLLKFRFDYYDKVDVSKISEIKLGNIEPRLEQATISFAILFYNIPEIFELFKKFLFEYQKNLVEERAGSFDGQIVNIMLRLQSEVGDITAANIAEVMSVEGYKTTAVTVGRHLKALKVDVKVGRKGKELGRYIQLSSEQIDSFKERYSVEYWDDQRYDNNPVISKENVTDVTEVTEHIGDYGIKNISNNEVDTSNKEIDIFQRSESPITSVTTVTSVTTEATECSFCNNNRLIIGTKKRFDPFKEGSIFELPICASCNDILSRKDDHV